MNEQAWFAEILWLGVAAAGGGLLALVGALLLVQGRPGGVAAVWGATLSLLVATGYGAYLGLVGVGDSPHAVLESLALATFSQFLPVLGASVLAAMASAWRGWTQGERLWRASLPLVALLAGHALLTVAAGFWVNNALFFLVRAALYLGLAVPVGLAWSTRSAPAVDPARLLALLTWAGVVVAGEVSARGLVILLLVRQHVKLPAELREEGLRRFLEVMEREHLASLGLGGLALVAALLAVLTAGRAPWPERAAGGLLVLALAVGLATPGLSPTVLAALVR